MSVSGATRAPEEIVHDEKFSVSLAGDFRHRVILVNTLVQIPDRGVSFPSDGEKTSHSLCVKSGSRFWFASGGTPEIDELFHELNVDTLSTEEPITQRNDGRSYTYGNLCSTLARSLKGTGVKPLSFYDVKGKGTTDVWLSGTPWNRHHFARPQTRQNNGNGR